MKKAIGAQRRPEITPGYDPPSAAVRSVQSGSPLNEGRRLPPATTCSRCAPQSVRALNEGRRLPPATTPPLPVPMSARRRGAQRRPEITPGYDDTIQRKVEQWTHRAQRRPEITPGYDGKCPRRSPGGGSTLNEGRRLPPATTRRTVGGVRHGHRRRSTKAGDYPRLRLRRVGASAGDGGALNEGRRLPPATTSVLEAVKKIKVNAQRRPEITPGYDTPRRKLHRPGCPLNEGRRLPPATTRPRGRVPLRAAPRPLNEGRRLPPATTPPLLVHRSHRRLRSTKAGDYPRLRPVGRRGPGPRRASRSTKAGDYPRLRHAFLHGMLQRNRVRSTKAGDYPRLRRIGAYRVSFPFSALNEGRRLPPATTRTSRRQLLRGIAHAQRRPEITPGYDLEFVRAVRPGRSAQRRPEITPGYDSFGRPCGPFRAARSTKAGDYPRLRRENVPGPHSRLDGAQRRPEITPGYDDAPDDPVPLLARTLNEGRRLPPATTSDLRARPRRPVPRRSTKAGDYPRLRHIAKSAGVSRQWVAQRRPEITPGYDSISTGFPP